MEQTHPTATSPCLRGNKHWYWPVLATLLIGYVAGGAMPVAIHYYKVFDPFVPDELKKLLYAFLLGSLGANVQMSIHFAREINSLSLGKQRALPSCFEFIGYSLKLVWGGIAAVFFMLSVKLGFLAAMGGAHEKLRLSAIVVISFCSGLRAYQILTALAGLIPNEQRGQVGPRIN